MLFGGSSISRGSNPNDFLVLFAISSITSPFGIINCRVPVKSGSVIDAHREKNESLLMRK